MVVWASLLQILRTHDIDEVKQFEDRSSHEYLAGHPIDHHKKRWKPFDLVTQSKCIGVLGCLHVGSIEVESTVVQMAAYEMQVAVHQPRGRTVLQVQHEQ